MNHMSLDKTKYLKSLTRDNIVEEARYWLDVPFKHQGRNERGIDCAGLIIEVAKAFDVVHQDFNEANYPRRSPHSKAFIQYFDKHLSKKMNNQIKPGDVAVLKEPVFPCHCGIIGIRNGELTLIHSHAPRKKVVEEFFFQSNWDKLHVATFEFPGVKE